MELYEACAANDYAKVQDLISAGANSINFINANDDNKTALHVAAEHLNEQIVQLLIRNGAEVSVSDRIGLTPFSRACLALGIIPHDTSLDQKELSCLRILAQFDSPVLSLDQYGNTVIHVLASRGTAAGFMLICTEIASFLSTKKIDVNLTTSYRNRHKLPPEGGSNAIDEEFLFTMECAWNIDPVVALILLPGWGFLTPLHLAADSGNAALLQTMLKHMKEKNFSYCQPFDALGWTPLHWAAMRNHRPCISTLVKIGGPKLCDRQDFMSRTPVDICFSFAHEATASWMLRRFVKDTDNRQSPPINSPQSNKALICFAAILTVCAGSEISLRALLLLAANKSWLALSLSFFIPPGIWWLLTTRNLALAFPLCLAKYGAIKTSMSAMPWQAARSVRRTVLNQHTADEQPCAVRADLRKEWHALWTQLHEWRNDPLLCAYLWWLQSHLVVENQQRYSKTKDTASAKPSSSIDRGPVVKTSVGQHASTYETYTSESSDSEDTTDPAHVIEIINQSRSHSSLSATSSSGSDYTGNTDDDPSSSDINLSNSDPRIATAILMSTTSEDDTEEIRTDRLMSSSSESSSSSEESSSPSNRPMAPIALKARLREMLSGGLAMTKGTVRRVLPSPPPLQRYRSADKGAAEGGATTGESTDNSASSSSIKTTSDLATSELSSSVNTSNTILSSLNASRESSGPWAPSSWLPGAAVGSAFRHSPSTTTNESNTKHGVEITIPSSPLIGAEAGNLLRWWRAAAQAAAAPPMSQTLNDELSLKWKQTPHFGSSWTGFDPATKSMSIGSIGNVKNPLLRQLAERWLTETSLEEGFVLWRAEFINLCKFVNEVPHLFCRIPNIVAASPDQQHRWIPPPRAPSPLAPDKLIQILRTRNPGIPENEIALASVLPFALKADSFSVLGEVVDLMRAEVCLRSTTSAAFSRAPEPPFTDIDVCHWKLFKPAQNLQQIVAEVWLPCVLDIAVALTVISLAEFPQEFIGVIRVAYLKTGTLVLLLGQIVSLVIWTLTFRAKFKATASNS